MKTLSSKLVVEIILFLNNWKNKISESTDSSCVIFVNMYLGWFTEIITVVVTYFTYYFDVLMSVTADAVAFLHRINAKMKIPLPEQSPEWSGCRVDEPVDDRAQSLHYAQFRWAHLVAEGSHVCAHALWSNEHHRCFFSAGVNTSWSICKINVSKSR